MEAVFLYNLYDRSYEIERPRFIDSVNMFVSIVHERNYAAGWWASNGADMRPVGDLPATSTQHYFIATKIALIHSEVSEALEAYRKGLPDDKLTDRPGLEVELCDTIIRCLDLLGAMGYTPGDTFTRILENNAVRPDHKAEARAAKGGKKF